MSVPDQLVVYPSAISPEMCDAIVKLGEKQKDFSGKIFTADGPAVDPNRRKDKIALIQLDAQSSWLYDEVETIFRTINDQRWHFNLTAFEVMQYSKYGAISSAGIATTPRRNPGGLKMKTATSPEK